MTEIVDETDLLETLKDIALETLEETARWIRVDECNQCGKCCKTLVSIWFMTGYSQESGLRTMGCLYLSERPDGRYECLIRSGEIDFSGLSEQVQEYYLQECLNYPNPDDPAHCPPRHDLLEGCGYRMVGVE